MSFQIIYKKLFGINILHEFFLNKGEDYHFALPSDERKAIMKNYDVSDFLAIQPSAATRTKLKNLQLVYKLDKTGIIVFGKAKETSPSVFKPIVKLPNKEKLTFYLSIKSPQFHNYTSLPLAKSGSHLYHFSNLAAGRTYPSLALKADSRVASKTYQSGDLVLKKSVNPERWFRAKRTTSAPLNSPDWKGFNRASALPNFSLGDNYLVGDVVKVKSGGVHTLYEAVSEVTTAITPPQEDTANWRVLATHPAGYPTAKDYVKTFPKIWKYTFTEDNITATATFKNAMNDVVYTEDLNSVDMREHTFNLNHLEGGYYKVNIEDGASYSKTVKFYLKDSDQPSDLFAAIDIYIKKGTGDLNLLSGSNEFKTPSFELPFLNRFTFWRYKSVESKTVLLETGQPKSLTKFGYIPVTISANQVPNPGVESIKPESDTIYSEVYL